MKETRRSQSEEGLVPAAPASESAPRRCARGSLVQAAQADAQALAAGTNTDNRRSEAHFSPGAKLADRYLIRRRIGFGGFGYVYAARDTELGCDVAIKVLKLGSEEALSQFRREVQLARQVTHPNVCRIFDLGFHRGKSGRIPFLTMELLEGETLDFWLCLRGVLPPALVASVCIQVAEAIRCAHRAGVVHSDIKPSNIILVKTQRRIRAVITDFGLSRAVRSSPSNDGVVFGTPAYVAPELVRGEPLDGAADYYSLGCTAFHLVTGAVPFDRDSPQETAFARLRESPPSAMAVDPGVPRQLDAVIQMLMDFDPRRRLADPATIKAVLLRRTFRHRAAKSVFWCLIVAGLGTAIAALL